MSTSSHRRRPRVHPDDWFYGTVTVTGMLACVGYALLLLQIAGGR